MSKHIDAAVKVGLVVSVAAVIVMSILLSRQREAVVRLNVQVNELEAMECEEAGEEASTCESDVRLLTACKESLKMARAEITRASKERQEAAALSSSSSGARAGPEGQEGWTAAPGAMVKAGDEASQKRVKDLFMGNLGIAPKQMEPLGELVCAAMALRQTLLDDYAQGQAGEAETWQQLTQLRKELTAEMAKVLGPEKYKEFRSAGGIGALASVVECGG